VSGGLGSWMPVNAYAAGGPIVRTPHVAVIGEGQYNEAVVPLPNGREIPVDLRGLNVAQQRAGGDNVTQTTIAPSISINVTSTASSPERAAQDAISPRTLRQIEDAIADAIASGSNRGLRSAVQGAAR
jgi:hypothetical protein